MSLRIDLQLSLQKSISSNRKKKEHLDKKKNLMQN